MKTLRVLLNKGLSQTAVESLRAMSSAAAPYFRVEIETTYSGDSEILLLWGIGGSAQKSAHELQRSRGGRTIMLDMGYVADPPGPNRMFRVSVDHPHPQHLLDSTSDRPSEWGLLVVKEPQLGSRVLLVDMGPKAVKQYEIRDWARSAAQRLEERGVPRHSMIHRPKPKNPFVPIPGVAHDNRSAIKDLLSKSRLVVTHHSNVGVEAVAAGVPVETEDGAAAWMAGKEWSYETRLSFINRLSRWQYRPSQAAEAWKFLRGFL